jgi:hypothetical protein
VQQAVCDSCIRTTRRQTRVECTAPRRYGAKAGQPCGHQWMLEHTDHCLVCGSYSYTAVAPSPGDIPAIQADIALRLAEWQQADPSADLSALTGALAVHQLAALRTMPETEPTERAR